MSKTNVIKDLSESEADKAVEDFKSEGCTDVKKEKQSDGNWTVRATCPER